VPVPPVTEPANIPSAIVTIKPEVNSGQCTRKKGIKKAAKIDPATNPMNMGFFSAGLEKQIADKNMGTSP